MPTSTAIVPSRIVQGRALSNQALTRRYWTLTPVSLSVWNSVLTMRK